MEKERYAVKKISKDCLFPETMCELKDTKSKFFVVLESKDDAVKIADLLNQQAKCINDLEEQIEQMAKDYTSEIAFWTGASDKQIAIRELEKLKESCEKAKIDIGLMLDYTTFNNILDKQIESLKGE